MDREFKLTYDQYVKDVLSGKQVAGKFVKKACERYLRFKKKYIFKEEEVIRVIRFISSFLHFGDISAGKPFILEPWQQFIIACVYGFYKEDGTRLTKGVYIEVARKNGKTALAAALSLYHLIADGVANAEVYLAANSKDQARIPFNMCSNFIKNRKIPITELAIRENAIEFSRTSSVMRFISMNSKEVNKLNASMYLLDEYHAAKNNRLKDVLQSSQAMRSNPTSIIITTAGNDKLGPCFEYRTMCVEVLEELKEDDSLFVLIFSLDPDDDWKAPENWIKANPNLGITVKEDFIESEINRALNSSLEEAIVKTKTLNIWQ